MHSSLHWRIPTKFLPLDTWRRIMASLLFAVHYCVGRPSTAMITLKYWLKIDVIERIAVWSTTMERMAMSVTQCIRSRCLWIRTNRIMIICLLLKIMKFLVWVTCCQIFVRIICAISFDFMCVICLIMGKFCAVYGPFYPQSTIDAENNIFRIK